jgi:hypothetical protein
VSVTAPLAPPCYSCCAVATGITAQHALVSLPCFPYLHVPFNLPHPNLAVHALSSVPILATYPALLVMHSSRQAQARLAGYDSFLAQVQQRLLLSTGADSTAAASLPVNGGSSSGTGSSMLDFLLQLSVALRPLTERDVTWVLQEAAINQQQQQQEEHQQEQQQQQQQNLWDSDQQPAPAHDPADWDWLLGRALQPLEQPLTHPTITQHTHLLGVLRGLAGMLRRLLPVRLRVRPAAEGEGWRSGLLRISVLRTSSSSSSSGSGSGAADAHEPAWQLVGLIYLDVGGAYGTRLLQYARVSAATWGQSSPPGQRHATASFAAAAPDTKDDWWDDDSDAAAAAGGEGGCIGAAAGPSDFNVPIVAVGITGSSSGSGSRSRSDSGCTSHPTSGRPAIEQLQDDAQQQQGKWMGETSTVQPLSPPPAQLLNEWAGCADVALSPAQLWELGHEMGHALHLVLSSRCAAAHPLPH